MKTEVTCVKKIASSRIGDTFEYRDMYNETKTIYFPAIWKMTEEEVEDYLNSDEEPE